MYWVVLMHKSMYQVNKECNKCSVLLRLNFCLLHTTSIFIQLISAYAIHRKHFIHTIVFAVLQTRKHQVCCFGRMSHKVYLALDCQKWGWNLDILLVWLAASWSCCRIRPKPLMQWKLAKGDYRLSCKMKNMCGMPIS